MCPGMACGRQAGEPTEKTSRLAIGVASRIQRAANPATPAQPMSDGAL